MHCLRRDLPIALELEGPAASTMEGSPSVRRVDRATGARRRPRVGGASQEGEASHLILRHLAKQRALLKRTATTFDRANHVNGPVRA
jgi:hypothetical protein